MISRDNFIGLMEQVGKLYNQYSMALEAIGLVDDCDSAIMTFIDKVLTVLIDEMEDVGVPAHDDIVTENCSCDHDMPLILQWCWDCNFGDGCCRLDGALPVITIEGHTYTIDSAAALYDCLSHLHQWRYHYDEQDSEQVDFSRIV